MPDDTGQQQAGGLMQGPRPRRRISVRARRVLVSIGLIAFLLPHVYTVAAGREMYPLTCAGMFAYQVTPQTPRYIFILTGEMPGEDVPRRVWFKEGRANVRHFFNYTYGSASDNTTHKHFPDDTPEAFAKRLGTWFTGYVKSRKNRNPDIPEPRTITLWLKQINPEDREPVAIMHFDAASSEVVLHPESVWPGDDVIFPKRKKGDGS